MRTGIDLIEIERVRKTIQRHGARFLMRIYTAKELSEVSDKPASLAVRFAAKEAVAKALGTGIGVIGWHDIEITRGPSREPILHLHGQAQQRAQELGLVTWSVSLSHTRSHAIALVVAMGKPNPFT